MQSNNSNNNNNNVDHHHEVTAHKQNVRVLECFPPYFDFGDNKEKQDNNDHVLSRIIMRKSAPHIRDIYNGTMNELTSYNELTSNSLKISPHVSDKGNSDSKNITLLYHVIFFFENFLGFLF